MLRRSFTVYGRSGTIELRPHHAIVIQRNVRVLRAAVHIAQSPNVGCCGAQKIVDFHGTAFGELHASCLKMQSLDVRRTSGGHQYRVGGQAESGFSRLGEPGSPSSDGFV